jgi:general nucleoside transport system permease protein
MAILTGGVLAGIAGAWLAVAYTPLWSENISAGRGWIALALVVFAGWRVMRALAGAVLFGAMSILHLALQGTGLQLSPHLLGMLPYVATLIVLLALTGHRHGLRADTPRALGQP